MKDYEVRDISGKDRMKMNLFKERKTSLAVYGILFVVYNVLYFAIPFPKNSASWIAYFFTLCSFVVSYWIFMVAFQNTEELESKVYGFPILRVGISYLAMQLIFGFVVDLLGYQVKVAGWVVVVVSVLLLAYALIGMIATDTARNVIEQQQEEVVIQTEKIAYFQLDIAGLADRAAEVDVKEKLMKLAEDVRFSDPVSSEALQEIEGRLELEALKLENMLGSNPEDCLTQIELLSNLLADRNRRCKALKGR